MTNTQRCQGKRRQFRNNTFSVFKCKRKATMLVTTKLGFTETHLCCDSYDCFLSISKGYVADARPIEKKR